MKFSACWIAKNEEGNIPRSIESVRGAVDELIVVDTGSTDNTAEAARAAGARVERFEWIGDFSAARNYAMSLVTGDVMFFLDADEWFKEPLTDEDKKKLEEIFAARPDTEAIQIKIRNLNDQGLTKTVSSGMRIIRNKKGLKFHKKVHELLARENGDAPDILVSDTWTLEHSGYADAVMPEKMRRNIGMLEEVAQNASDPEERHLQHCYLVREYYHLEKPGECMRHLRAVLDAPELIKRQYVLFRDGFAPLVYIMLLAASENRSSVSRRELYRKLVEPFKKYLVNYPGASTIELFYKALFDLKEDALLSGIKPAMQAAEKAPPTQIAYYREAEMIVNQRAAEAALRQGKPTDAIDYAVASFKHTQNKNASALNVLLCCMRGLPAPEIIAFLNSQFDVGNPKKLEYLSRGTRMYGFRDVYAYYLDKRIRMRLATKGDYLYLLILYGKFYEAVAAAIGIYDEDTSGAARECLFLAAVCSRDERIYRDNAERMDLYANILDAYFSSVPLQNVTKAELDILVLNYGLVAMAAGLGRANELRRVFSSCVQTGFLLMAKYCSENGLYEDAISEPVPDPDDYDGNIYVIDCLVMTGRCEEARERIESLFGRGVVNEKLMNYLLAVEARSKMAGYRARTLYNRYTAPLERFTDLSDVVNTGYFTDDSYKKKAKSYKSTTPAQFRKQLEEDAAIPHIDGFAAISARAGDVYAEKGAHAAAMECYRFSAAQGHDVDANFTKLVEMFSAMGNYQLAGALKRNI